MLSAAAQKAPATGQSELDKFKTLLTSPAALPKIEPEAAGGAFDKSTAVGSRTMAVTANSHATQAALDVLQRGGNALDAALAAQWVLNVVEPQSSGIGGGGFLLFWDAKTRRLTAWDGRETAPLAADENFARQADGSLATFDQLVATGKSVGTPGLVAMLASAHALHGKLPWASSFQHAVQLAEQGFLVSPRLNKLLREDAFLRRNPAARALYYRENDLAVAVGDTLRNGALAESFRVLAREGASAFYHGRLAEEMSSAVQAQGGWLSKDDLAHYRPKVREAVCGDYRRYRICGMPPPSSGGLAVVQLLGMLERSGPPLRTVLAPASVHRFAEAGRLAFADRARYMADPDFQVVPQAELLNPAYLSRRAALIDLQRSMGRAVAGEWPGNPSLSSAASMEIPATTHLSIVDAEGNAVALTSSIESGFGSRIMVGGFLLNNQLTDFSFTPQQGGAPVANRLQAGKRPLSSMSPTVVFDPQGDLWAVLGSPGGPRIINYVAQTLVALIDAGMRPDMALAMPHVGSRNGPTEIETGDIPADLIPALLERGHALKREEMTSGIHLIVRDSDMHYWLGAADPRREGLADGN